MTSDYKELLSILNAHRVKRYDARRFPEPGPFFRMGHEPVGVDLLTTIPGIDFDSAWARKVEAVFDDETDLRVHVISREA